MIRENLNADSPRIQNLLGVLVTISLFAFAYRHYWNYEMFAYGDLPVFPGSFKDAFNAFVSSWQPDSRGNILVQLPSLLFQAVFLFILKGNALLAQKIYVLVPLPLAFIAMYFFLGRYIKSRLAKYLGAFIYSVNPHTMGSGFLGGSFGMIYAHALFPLLLIFLFDMFKKDSAPTRRIGNMLLFTFLFGFTFSNSGSIVIFILPVMAFLVIRTLAQKDGRFLGESVVLILGCLIIFSLLILPWLYGSIHYILPYLCPFLAKVEDIASPTAGPSTQLSVVMGAYSSQRFINMLTLQWREVAIRTIWGFIIPVMAFLSLLLTQYDKKKFRIALKFSIGAVLLLLFFWLTHLKLTGWLFTHFPVLFNFRNTAKPSLLLSFFYASLIAIGVEEIIKRFSGMRSNLQRRLCHGYLLAFIAVIAIFSQQFFTGDMRVRQDRGPGMFIPKSFYETGKWLDERRSSEGFFRTLWLPWVYDETEIKLRWIDQYTLNTVLGLTQYIASPTKDYTQFVTKTLCAGQTRYLGSLLAHANVKYVIVNLLSQQRGRCRFDHNYAFGSPINFAKVLNRQKDLRLIITKPDLSIYENKNFKPHVTAWDKIYFISEENLDILNLSTIKYPLIFEESVSPEQKRWLLKNSNVISLPGKEMRKRDYLLPEEVKSYQCRVTKIRDSEYNIRLETGKPIFVLFGEKHHPKWDAYSEGGKLKHFPAFYGNLFYLDKVGATDIRVVFGEQRAKDITIVISITTWILLLIGVICASLIRIGVCGRRTE